MDLLRAVAPMLRAISHPVRLRIIDLLKDGCEARVSEGAECAELPQAQTSQQLAILKGHGVVAGRREGQHVYYSLAQPRVSQVLRCIHSGPTECAVPQD